MASNRSFVIGLFLRTSLQNLSKLYSYWLFSHFLIKTLLDRSQHNFFLFQFIHSSSVFFKFSKSIPKSCFSFHFSLGHTFFETYFSLPQRSLKRFSDEKKEGKKRLYDKKQQRERERKKQF